MQFHGNKTVSHYKPISGHCTRGFLTFSGGMGIDHWHEKCPAGIFFFQINNRDKRRKSERCNTKDAERIH